MKKHPETCKGCGKEITIEKDEVFHIVGFGSDMEFWHHECYINSHDMAGNYTGDFQ